MKLKYSVFLLSLMLALATCSHAMQQGKINAKLTAYIYNANLAKFNDMFTNNQASVDDMDYNGDPILHTALVSYATFLDKKSFKKINNVRSMIQFLLDNQKDVNKPNDTGRTPLHVAAYNNLDTIIPLLLEYGADINTQDKKGNTPLHDALLPLEPRREALETLLKHNARVDIKNDDKLTADELLQKKIDELPKHRDVFFQAADITREELAAQLTAVQELFDTYYYNTPMQKGLLKIREREKEKPSTDTCFSFQ